MFFLHEDQDLRCWQIITVYTRCNTVYKVRYLVTKLPSEKCECILMTSCTISLHLYSMIGNEHDVILIVTIFNSSKRCSMTTNFT